MAARNGRSRSALGVAEPVEDAPPQVRLLLLQAPRLAPPDAPAQVLPHKDAALLAMLALHGPTPRSRATALLWPDAGDAGANNNLRQRLFRLRRAAGRDLVRNAATLSLAVAVEHDLQDPSAALRRDPLAAAGTLLGGCDYGDHGELAAWVAAARQRWCTRLREALMAIALDLERRGAAREAMPYALRLRAEAPAHEPAVQLLMRLCLSSGERAAAIAEFDRYAAACHERHGQPPSDDTVALARLVGRSAAASYAAPTPLALALRHPPRTVGRDAVFVAAERCWQGAGVVLLTGPAGIGKTRVFDELARRWGIAARLRAQAGDADGTHGLFARVVAALLPHLGAGLGAADTAALRWIGTAPGQARPTAVPTPAGWAGLLRAACSAAWRGGLAAMAIDDLHLADAASLALLSAVWSAAPDDGASAAAGRMRWLLAARAEPALPAGLQAWLDTLRGGDDPVVPVPPLDAAHGGELVASVSTTAIDAPAWAAPLDRHCGGHPLFVLQVLRELHQALGRLPERPPAHLPVPVDTLASVARRLDRTEPAAQQLAFVAALCGVDFGAALAAGLLHCTAAELLVPWRRLEAMNILHGTAFSHELVRQAVLGALPPSVAPLIHREIAASLQGGAATGRRAVHWEAGAAHAEAARDFTSAADDALRRGLRGRACEWLQRAAHNHRQAGQHGAAFVCAWRAGHLLLAMSSAAEAQASAAALLASADGPAQRARALELLAQAKTQRHDGSALQDAETAHALAGACGDPALAALTRLGLAAAWALLGRHAQALQGLQALKAQAAWLDPLRNAERRDLRHAVLADLGRRHEAVGTARRALRAAERRDDIAAAAGHAGHMARQLHHLGHIAEATAMAEQAVAWGRQAGGERGHVLVDELMLAGCLGDMGRYGAALAIFERITRALQDGGYTGWAAAAENEWAGLYLRLGRPDLAQRLLAGLLPDAPAWARATRHLAVGRLQQWRGGSALPALQEAARLFDGGGAPGDPCVRERVELELARWSAPDVAARRPLLTLRWACRHQHVTLAWQAAMVRTEALLQLGRPADAARAATALATRFAGGWRACDFYLPELWLVLCDAWAADGQTARAAALAAHGARWLKERLAQDVPAPYRDSFLQRNPFNARLLGWSRDAPLNVGAVPRSEG